MKKRTIEDEIIQMIRDELLPNLTAEQCLSISKVSRTSYVQKTIGDTVLNFTDILRRR